MLLPSDPTVMLLLCAASPMLETSDTTDPSGAGDTVVVPAHAAVDSSDAMLLLSDDGGSPSLNCHRYFLRSTFSPSSHSTCHGTARSPFEVWSCLTTVHL